MVAISKHFFWNTRAKWRISSASCQLCAVPRVSNRSKKSNASWINSTPNCSRSLTCKLLIVSLLIIVINRAAPFCWACNRAASCYCCSCMAICWLFCRLLTRVAWIAWITLCWVSWSIVVAAMFKLTWCCLSTRPKFWGTISKLFWHLLWYSLLDVREPIGISLWMAGALRRRLIEGVINTDKGVDLKSVLLRGVSSHFYWCKREQVQHTQQCRLNLNTNQSIRIKWSKDDGSDGSIIPWIENLRCTGNGY